jgi:hypothetical protein
MVQHAYGGDTASEFLRVVSDALPLGAGDEGPDFQKKVWDKVKRATAPAGKAGRQRACPGAATLTLDAGPGDELMGSEP